MEVMKVMCTTNRLGLYPNNVNSNAQIVYLCIPQMAY